MAITEDRIGDIDQEGFINSLDRKGFTKVKCISEIYANSIDAQSKIIKYYITREKIFIIDDGIGMNKQETKNAFSVFKSNHREDQSMGVSGIGLKAALKRLSNDGRIEIITKKIDSTYFKITVDWKKMIKDKKYYENIIRVESDQSDIDKFNQDRASDEYNKTGTTIMFDYDEEFHEILKQNFNIGDTEDKYKITSNQKLSVIFGKCKNIKTYYEDYNKLEEILPLYDYFRNPKSQYYNDKEKQIIKLYKNNQLKDDYRFIWEKEHEHEYREIIKDGRGYAKKSKEISPNFSQCTLIGQFEVHVGVQYDPEYFDDTKPEEPKNGNNYLSPDDKKILNIKEDVDFHQTISLYRNYQYIGSIIVPEQNVSSSRASNESYFKLSIVHCEVHYFPQSHQNNEQDIISGIQENKNQYQDNFPIHCKRLFKEIKDNKAIEIWNWMNSLITKHTEQINKTEQNLARDTLVNEPSDKEITNQEEDNFINTQSSNIDFAANPNQYPNLLVNEFANTYKTEDQTSNLTNAIEEQASNLTNAAEDQTPNLTNIQEQPKIAITVESHRKGKVTGKELLEQINKMNIDPEEEYTANYIELYNLISKINTASV